MLFKNNCSYSKQILNNDSEYGLSSVYLWLWKCSKYSTIK